MRFFCPQGEDDAWPTTIFAAGVGPGSPSHRPRETVAPLADFLGQRASLTTTHLKDQIRELSKDILSRDGVVLVSWEHKRLGPLLECFPHAPAAPEWPDKRFDIVFVLDREGASWRFSQRPQRLLAGDSNEIIA